MRSILGCGFAICAAIGFALCWWWAVRAEARWFDAQWLFLAALPFNWSMLRLTGESNFAPDATGQALAALLVDAALAYLAGALIEALARGGVRLVRRRGRA